jgi:putative transposase
MQMKKCKFRVGIRWWMDKTYIKIKGQRCYLYRAVDKFGNTVDFLLTIRKQRMIANSYLINAIKNNCKPRLINIDKSGSNISVIKVYNNRSFSKITIRQCKYFDNIVVQDHRFIKWRILNGLGFKNFESGKRTLSGIEVVHMLRKKQISNAGITMFKSFCSLVSTDLFKSYIC